MHLGYNTNGLACHRWDDALSLLADSGYESVAITLDHDCLDPYAPGLQPRRRATVPDTDSSKPEPTACRRAENPYRPVSDRSNRSVCHR